MLILPLKDKLLMEISTFHRKELNRFHNFPKLEFFYNFFISIDDDDYDDDDDQCTGSHT